MRDYYWGNTEAEQATPKKTEDTNTPYENNDGDEWNAVECSGNKIYFYSSVTRPKILKLNKSIVNMSNGLTTRSLIYGTPPAPIKLHINSYGGSVFAGMAAVDYIKRCKTPIESIIDGCAASAATLMSVVADHRSMHKNSCMLIHQLSGHMWGKFNEMQDDMKNSEMLMKKIKTIYRDHCCIPEAVLEDILKHDIWWDAETCLKYGLVDEII
jgi:ATP-dependent protease ClpP protease subunit